jgi:hypothetical protein
MSTVGAGRLKSIGPVRTGVLGGVVSMMSIALQWAVEHCSQHHVYLDAKTMLTIYSMVPEPR